MSTPKTHQPTLHHSDSHPDHTVNPSASHVIRKQIDHIYQQSPPHQTDDVSAPYDQTYDQNYDLQQYHAAWQQYYQQYYLRYYLHQLQQHQQTNEQKARDAASRPKPDIITGTNHAHTAPSQVALLKNTLLQKVKTRASTFRRSHHFIPIASALVVGMIFLFLQYNRVLFAEVNAYVSPGSAINESDTVLVDPSANLNVGPEPKLIIPKINVNIHIVYDIASLDDAPVQEGLKHGVVHYKLPGASSLPGQIGNSVLLGHSSNDIFDPGDYKFAFVLLDKLQDGDVFYIHYQGKRYIYRVTGKQVIKPSQINTLQIKADKPLATLVTCTPLGTATNRLLVTGEQISPDPATATKQNSSSANSKDVQLPGNSPTLLERVRDIFF